MAAIAMVVVRCRYLRAWRAWAAVLHDAGTPLSAPWRRRRTGAASPLVSGALAMGMPRPTGVIEGGAAQRQGRVHGREQA